MLPTHPSTPGHILEKCCPGRLHRGGCSATILIDLGGDGLRLVLLCNGGVPCLRRSRALLYRAHNNRCYSDPISAPAQIKLRAAASRFSMALRGETASSLTACPPLLTVPFPGFVLSSGGRRETSCCEPLGADAARLPPFALQIHLKESNEPFRCTQAGFSVPYLGGKP